MTYCIAISTWTHACTCTCTGTLYLQILSDERRKRRYDYFGDEENIIIGEPHKQRTTGREEEEEEPEIPLFSFSFGPSPDSSDEINSQEFFKEVLPASMNSPHLLYFYNDFCDECKECGERWNQMRKVSNPLPCTLYMYMCLYTLKCIIVY